MFRSLSQGIGLSCFNPVVRAAGLLHSGGALIAECREIFLRRGDHQGRAAGLHHLDAASLHLLVELGSAKRHLTKPGIDPPGSRLVVSCGATLVSVSGLWDSRFRWALHRGVVSKARRVVRRCSETNYDSSGCTICSYGDFQCCPKSELLNCQLLEPLSCLLSGLTDFPAPLVS